ncbi:glutathione S-transferase [Janthinobacterium lividum]|uniref:Glutathione S-transferase n=1 Tax=Janthinobacterium lividum TaxID=29581 RepID=A0ABU0XV10_9BURK|nr:glutathione S-transferase [Janthinobacterium lividum]MDQ4626271.1 glutathione S-transferase [Janthinobacterium lividum]MDQ4674762.1 glutathione S-transferase [Janthinobacterium lividum]MDQ4685494.1 glutathione S-transferase [Janthinobacterium lividum]
MKLIGMLDSPYVRRVAICLQLQGVSYEHLPLSVFRNMDAVREINPVIKVPTLVLDDGQVLMDSTLILHYLSLLRPGTAVPALADSVRALRLTGLALAACEKAVQIVYERKLRPLDKQHAPWLERVSMQLHAAWNALEQECAHLPLPGETGSIDQAGVTIAVGWSFAQLETSDIVKPSDYPAIHAYTRSAETLSAFLATPPV